MISCCHILLKHKNSRTPYDKFRNKQVTRTKEEATEIINFLYKKLKEEDFKFDTFKMFAYEYSECSSAANGGDLGSFNKGTMQESFENSAFNLDVNEVTSEPVSSDSGIHLILRYK